MRKLIPLSLFALLRLLWARLYLDFHPCYAQRNRQANKAVRCDGGRDG